MQNERTDDYRTWSIDTCIICDIRDNRPWVPFRRIFHTETIPTEILYEDNYFFIIADVAPLTDGHYLICTNEHIASYSHANEDILRALVTLKINLRHAFQDVYGKLSFFEHGSGSESSGGCCINHAHLHVLPLSYDLLPILNSSYSFEEIDTDEILQLKGERPYLFYEDSEGHAFLSKNTSKAIPSQYFRRVISENGVEKVAWNWRDQVQYAEALDTKSKIARSRERFPIKKLHENLTHAI